MLNTVPFVCIRTTTTNARKKTRKISFIRQNLWIVVFKQQNRVHNRGYSPTIRKKTKFKWLYFDGERWIWICTLTLHPNRNAICTSVNSTLRF